MFYRCYVRASLCSQDLAGFIEGRLELQVTSRSQILNGEFIVVILDKLLGSEDNKP